MFEVPDIARRERSAVDAGDGGNHRVELRNRPSRSLTDGGNRSELPRRFRIERKYPSMEVLVEHPSGRHCQTLPPFASWQHFYSRQYFGLRDGSDKNARGLFQCQPAKNSFRW